MKPLKESPQTLSKGCLNCGVTPIKLKMNYKLSQGFGGSHIELNRKIFYMPEIWRDGNVHDYFKTLKTLMTFELRARKIKGDWRMVNDTPLHSEVYQRQGRNNWVMIKKGMGFA